ncbi:DUF5677 domain-containing protein [Clostridium perfringens]|uniref:DUF5677 domain-containing protein n=1 Tax=Clostridium perfringens TaxID=1502 RepID=UPI0013E2FD50|nr:DUF5677 domain-containing protein [Clostridium perfringens]MBI6044759.1 hypothetical protein [Clostridium perfringens]MBI6047045.1 hypothetical protein [Clostridium perfringens]MDJ8925188.1 DUF5677 domain-containing protein [Clostridium perfringens]MDJ8929374.1 DUF5677 domain-containing protein [Clostridium perfringens]MDJ8934518.1 DUF5677 domain-containing protein [Clostridium perfringens]
MEENIYKVIYNECIDQFEFAENLSRIVELDVITKINEKSQYNKNSKDLNNALIHLGAYGIKNYKASLILVGQGYSICALSTLRTLVEVILNIDYILEDKTKIHNRAKEYLEGFNRKTVLEKAERSLNKGLYKVYRILCEFCHSNFKGTKINSNNGKVSITEDSSLSKEVATITNSIFLYFVKVLIKHYNIKINFNEYLNIPKDIKELYDFYNTEKDLTDSVLNIIKEVCTENLNNDCSEKYLIVYKNFKMDKLKPNKYKK